MALIVLSPPYGMELSFLLRRRAYLTPLTDALELPSALWAVRRRRGVGREVAEGGERQITPF